MPCSRTHQQIFHIVGSWIRTRNLYVIGPTFLTAMPTLSNFSLLTHPSILWFLSAQTIYVNLDSLVLEVLHEAKCMHKLGIAVPTVILNMCAKEVELKAQQNRWDITDWIKCFSNQVLNLTKTLCISQDQVWWSGVDYGSNVQYMSIWSWSKKVEAKMPLVSQRMF